MRQNAAQQMEIQEEIPISIRRASEGDLEAIAMLLHHLGYPMSSTELEPILREVLDNPDAEVLVAVEGDHEMAGLISLRSFASLKLKGRQVSIDELVVHPSFRGRGIGRQLLRCARRFARERGAVLLEVHTNRNRESYKRRFYEKNAFIPANTALYRMALD